MDSSYVSLEVEILNDIELTKARLENQSIEYNEDWSQNNVVFITVSISTEELLSRNKNLIIHRN